METGTPRALARVVGLTLMWVERQRRSGAEAGMTEGEAREWADDLRRVELCAQAAKDQVLLARWLGVPEDGWPPEPAEVRYYGRLPRWLRRR